ncbi:hypothetical protein [Mycobacterium alsense]|uniref:Rv0361 family membrane protein n=1 Tax=Mycobacterium alsense TaxID=324058 RepID=UPI000B128BD6|nr:hypothetical protein [Mycobacterium alsense]
MTNDQVSGMWSSGDLDRVVVTVAVARSPVTWTLVTVVAVLIAVAVLAVGGVLGYQRVIAPKLAENQIKTLVQNVTNAQNNADGQGLLQLDCERARGQNPVTSQMLRNDIDEEGTVATTVTNVHVTGDRATATVTTTRSKSPDDHMPETWSFVKEKGSWKWCGRADNSG